jgi:hypothetical protein
MPVIEIECFSVEAGCISFLAKANHLEVSKVENLLYNETGEVHFIQLGSDGCGNVLRKFTLNTNQLERLRAIAPVHHLMDREIVANELIVGFFERHSMRFIVAGQRSDLVVLTL